MRRTTSHTSNRRCSRLWSFVEYGLSGTRYSVLVQGQLCVSCHVQARKTDYVFRTK